MQWSDEGVILSVRPHGETGAVLELFTRQHGRHLGLVHGGRSRKLRPILQVGNHVDATWKARLADNLGHFGVELRKGFAAHVMEDPAALAALTLLALGAFTAGVHIGAWRICLVGIILGVGVPAIAWLEQSALFLLLAVAVLAGGIAPFFWHGSREGNKGANPASP
jgi:hypothetical protein